MSLVWSNVGILESWMPFRYRGDTVQGLQLYHPKMCVALAPENLKLPEQEHFANRAAHRRMHWKLATNHLSAQHQTNVQYTVLLMVGQTPNAGDWRHDNNGDINCRTNQLQKIEPVAAAMRRWWKRTCPPLLLSRMPRLRPCIPLIWMRRLSCCLPLASAAPAIIACSLQ